MENNLSNTKLAFIGCGVMAESIIGGLLREELVRVRIRFLRATHMKTDEASLARNTRLPFLKKMLMQLMLLRAVKIPLQSCV